MVDISGFGLRVTIIASNTFPSGFTVTQFADDADPFDFPNAQIVDSAPGLNGDALYWSKASLLTPVLNIVPNSEDDKNLAALSEANRVGKGKRSAQDVITMVGIYPDGHTITLSNGKLTNTPVANSVASAGRMKSKAYTFTFENKAES